MFSRISPSVNGLFPVPTEQTLVLRRMFPTYKEIARGPRGFDSNLPSITTTRHLSNQVLSRRSQTRHYQRRVPTNGQACPRHDEKRTPGAYPWRIEYFPSSSEFWRHWQAWWPSRTRSTGSRACGFSKEPGWEKCWGSSSRECFQPVPSTWLSVSSNQAVCFAVQTSRERDTADYFPAANE